MTDQTRTSKMAIASAVVAATPAVIIFTGMERWTAFVVLLGALSSIMLAIASLIRIGLSNGRLRGRAWAWIGIGASLVVLLLWVGVPGFVFWVGRV